MSNHTTHRRMLAAPEPKPKPSMDPTLKRQTKPSTSHHLSINLDPSIPSKPSSMSTTTSTVNASQRVNTSQRPSNSQQSKKPTKELEKKKVDQVVVVKKKSSNNNKTKEAQKEMVGFEEGHEIDIKRLSVSLNYSGSGGGGGGGRRRSLSSTSSQVQLADVFASNGVKVVSADMPPFMQIHAVECARKTHDSLEKFTSKTLALTLKKEFDGVYGPAWHCIVGTSFGSFVTHSVSGFMYFSMDQKLYILLFKTTVQRAD